MKLALNLANYSTLCSSSCTIRPSRDVLPSKKLSRFFTCATAENVWTMKLKPSSGKYNLHLSRMRKLDCFILFLTIKMTRVFKGLNIDSDYRDEEKNTDGSEKEITYGEYVEKINKRALEEQKKIMLARMRGELKK